VNYKKGVGAMKKVLMIVLCLCFLYSFSEYISAQQRTEKGIQIDSTSMKRQTPSTRTREQKAQVKKTGNEKLELHNLKPWQNDRPLLMKEKDSLQKKVQ
jgi:hypothetical protein